MTNYNKEKQIHSLSQASNAAFNVQSQSSLQGLQELVTSIIQDTLTQTICTDYIGTDWKAVWGPVVYSANSSANPVIADNTMVLFYSPGQNLLVLAIAGTNPPSKVDWKDEDEAIIRHVSWQTITHNPQSSAGPISQGTATGLDILNGMTDTSSGLTLLQKLAEFTPTLPPNVELAVAGHSLGGALSPAMALYLHDVQHQSTPKQAPLQPVIWNAANRVTVISVWPTAGPTLGGRNFASDFETLLTHPIDGQASLQYTSKYNTLDIVPLAWNMSTLNTIKTLYDNYKLTFPSELTKCLLVAIDASRASFIDYLQIGATSPSLWIPMEGTFYDVTPTEDPCHQFVQEAGYQHTTAYNTLLGITEFAAGFQQIRNQHGIPPTNHTETTNLIIFNGTTMQDICNNCGKKSPSL